MVFFRSFIALIIFIVVPQFATGQTFEGAITEVFSIEKQLESLRGLEPPPIAPDSELNPIPKNRFISFIPTNPNRLTALRVRLTSLNHPTGFIPPGTRDFSMFEGAELWVGPPSTYPEDFTGAVTFKAAALQCQPHFMDWGAVGLVHVYGTQIVPSSVYDVQAVMAQCDINHPDCASPFLTVLTGPYGDTKEPYEFQQISRQPNAADISAVVDKVKVQPGARSKVFTKLQPALLNPADAVSAEDIARSVDAVKGYPYTFGMTVCP